MQSCGPRCRRPRVQISLEIRYDRVYEPYAFRRRGWVVVGRRLVSVEDRVRVTCPDDAARLLPQTLPALFDTAQLAETAAIERRVAQQMTYCLRAMGVLHTAGKRGNAIVYRLA